MIWSDIEINEKQGNDNAYLQALRLVSVQVPGFSGSIDCQYVQERISRSIFGRFSSFKSGFAHFETKFLVDNI